MEGACITDVVVVQLVLPFDEIGEIDSERHAVRRRLPATLLDERLRVRATTPGILRNRLSSDGHDLGDLFLVGHGQIKLASRYRGRVVAARVYHLDNHCHLEFALWKLQSTAVPSGFEGRLSEKDMN